MNTPESLRNLSVFSDVFDWHFENITCLRRTVEIYISKVNDPETKDVRYFLPIAILILCCRAIAKR